MKEGSYQLKAGGFAKMRGFKTELLEEIQTLDSTEKPFATITKLSRQLKAWQVKLWHLSSFSTKDKAALKETVLVIYHFGSYPESC